MSKYLSILRDTAANLDAFTGPVGTFLRIWDTTQKRLRIFDGATLGGNKVAMAQDTFGFLPMLQGVKYVPIFGSNLPLGDNDIYTVPAGKKAWIHATFRDFNPTGGSITYYKNLRIGGTLYRYSPNVTLATMTGINAGIGSILVLNAGEKLSINCATTAGLNVRGAAFEFDASETRFGTARILGLAAGDNLLLTVPAGKALHPVTQNGNISGVQGALFIGNYSGGALNYLNYQVPNGGVAGPTNQLYPATAIADQTTGALNVGPMAAGDSVVVNSSGGAAGQLAFLTYYQIP